MILLALISSRNKELRVIVTLDPRSACSYISVVAAKELEFHAHGQELNLTTAGTRGAEIKTCSGRVERPELNFIECEFSSPSQAHIFDNIAGGSPAI